MRIGVTGSHGFIGSHMMRFLTHKGHTAIPLYVYDAFPDDLDWVFHFAANMGGVGFFSTHQWKPFVDNMRMDMTLLEKCAESGVKRVFYPASACAYPVHLQKNDVFTVDLAEHMLLPGEADQLYGWEKLMMILLAPCAPVDVRVGILNTVFGEGQIGTGERAKFPPAITHKVIEAKKTGKPIKIWGDGNQKRTFLYIQDALEKMYEIMESPGYSGEVNVASDEIVTVRQCADWLCEIAGIEPKYEFDLSQPSGVLERRIDNSKFNELYKYRSKFSTRQGFEQLYHWMEGHV